MKIVEYNHLKYYTPNVTIIADNGIGHSEFAGRTCYDSFDSSENEEVKELNTLLSNEDSLEEDIEKNVSEKLCSVENSELLKKLSFVHFHHSVLEHSVITFFIQGTSRAVLQELARHRLASYSVRSTRYTLDDIMYNFIVSKYIINDSSSSEYFVQKCLELDLFTVAEEEINIIELNSIYKKLNLYTDKLGQEKTLDLIIPKPNIEDFLNSDNVDTAFEVLERKKKRNVGDSFKAIVVSETFKVDLTMTVNLRSLKNFFDLRLPNSAWFQIQWLAEEMKSVLPTKYKKLIFKDFKDN